MELEPLRQRANQKPIGAHDAFAQMRGIVRTGYAHPSPLIVFARASPPRVLWSTQGTRQGDPTGAIAFAAAIHPALVAAQAAHSKVTILAYADDITVIAANPADAEAAVIDICRRLAAIGLETNAAKCFTAGPLAEAKALAARLGWPLPSSSGARVLGAWVEAASSPTRAAGEAEFFRQLLARYAPFFRAICLLPPAAAIAVLGACGPARWAFCARTNPFTPQHAAAAEAFDEHVGAAIATTAGTDSLPQRGRLPTFRNASAASALPRSRSSARAPSSAPPPAFRKKTRRPPSTRRCSTHARRKRALGFSRARRAPLRHGSRACPADRRVTSPLSFGGASSAIRRPASPKALRSSAPAAGRAPACSPSPARRSRRGVRHVDAPEPHSPPSPFARRDRFCPARCRV